MQGAGGVVKSFGKNPKYSNFGFPGGSDYSFNAEGWRFENTASSDSAVVSRIQFDEVGKYTDGSFTMGAWCIPRAGTETYAWIMSIGKTTSQQPAIGIGYYGSLGRRMTSWDGSGSFTGSNDDIKFGERYFVALKYDAVADTLQGRWYNLERGTVLEYNQTSKTWPSNVQTSLSLGGHHRSTVYYDPMEGSMTTAFFDDRIIPDDELWAMALGEDEFFIEPRRVISAAVPPVTGLTAGTFSLLGVGI
jgi:hypothetical protein